MPNIKTEIRDEQVQAAFSRLLAAAEKPDAALDAVGRVLKSNRDIRVTSCIMIYAPSL